MLKKENESYTDAVFPTMEPNVPSSNWPIPYIIKGKQKNKNSMNNNLHLELNSNNK